jgi:hypothetical protein
MDFLMGELFSNEFSELKNKAKVTVNLPTGLIVNYIEHILFSHCRPG